MTEQVISSKPVEVSPDAHRALTAKIRQWAGQPTARLVLGKPRVSTTAECDHETKTFTFNPEPLILNPNRVLLTVTPFRLRQEAVLTGAMLHEVGHARHTHWKPRSTEELATKPALHSDGTVPTKQVMALAQLMEEPRVEGLIARDADKIGAAGLGWTMRATTAKLLGSTVLAGEPDQKIMDIITSWALRAGRQIALAHHVEDHVVPGWAHKFNSLLHNALVHHFASLGEDIDDTVLHAQFVTSALIGMATSEEDSGPRMLDLARAVLEMLFPETDGDADDAPMPGGCQMEAQPEPQPDDEEENEDEGDGAGGDSPADDSEDDAESDEAESGEVDGDGADDADDDADGDDADGDSDGAGDSDGGDDSGDGGDSGDDDDLAEELAELETAADEATAEEVAEESTKPPPVVTSGSQSGTGGFGGGWRDPTPEEREIARGAEGFLRDLISPSESNKTVLTEAPSATVDGAALAAWKAGGQIRDPRFFLRTQRNVEPAPPVQIAVLVDVSGSMDRLQKPSAVLSWALSSAALDLRNFAGRGRQVESTLIHWGTSVRVIQRNGEALPGIRELRCTDGTTAMGHALDMVEEELPGFFDVTDKPVNRLLVQFTDWELNRRGLGTSTTRVQRALAAGVNMLSVVPEEYNWRKSRLSAILKETGVRRGRAEMIKYNPDRPGAIWDAATRLLS